MKLKTTALLFVLVPFIAFAQVPAGYYSAATGSAFTLKTQLYNIIKGHNSRSYGDLWTFYSSYELDVYYENDGSILDIYSENPSGADPYNYSKVTNQCGNYSGEGSCYNREHTFPKSWFNDASPMYSDVFHILASDGYVNGIRGNYPYGEVQSASFTSQNGSKLGNAKSGLGYSGTVFEPINEFKGDLARIYFYMATRYENVIAGWQNNSTSANAVLNGTSAQVYEDWVVDMLLAWHTNDPVSQKEIDRNNNAYTFQGNRNPYVDHPEWVNVIWGDGSVPAAAITTTASANGYNFGEVAAGMSSAYSSYKVSGTNLSSGVTVSVQSPFSLSLNSTSWSTSVLIPEANAETNASNTVYVRFSPTVANGQSYNASISHSAAGAVTVNVPISGKELTVNLTNIADVRSLPDNSSAIVQGYVTTPDYGFTDGQFFVQDQTGGINVFYEGQMGAVSQGDYVRINGIKSTFSSENLIELLPSSLEILSTGNERVSPAVITANDLNTASSFMGMLVSIPSTTLVDPNQWPTTSITTGASVNVDATAGSTPFQIKIDRDQSYYDGTPLPNGTLLTITGVLTRNGSAVQIMPFINGDVKVTDLTPKINPSLTSLSFLSIVVGEVSASKSLTLSALNLSENLTISTSGDFQISSELTGTYGNQLSFSHDAGSLTNKAVFVRFSPTATGTRSGNLTLSSTGVTKVISLSGAGVLAPVVNVTTSAFAGNFGQITIGTSSSQSSYSVSGSQLIQNLVVTAPVNFEVSLFASSGFGPSLSFTPINGTVQNTTVHVRFKPTIVGERTGYIVNESGAALQEIEVNGLGVTSTTSIENNTSQIKIYPNPANNLLVLDGVDPTRSVIRIFDSLGVRQGFTLREGAIDVTDYSSGVYYVIVESGGKKSVNKVIINR